MARKPGRGLQKTKTPAQKMFNTLLAVLGSNGLVALLTWLVSKREKTAVAVKSELDNVEHAITIWKNMASDLEKKLDEVSKKCGEMSDKCDELTREVSYLRRENHQLKKQIEKFGKSIEHNS